MARLDSEGGMIDTR